MLTHHVFRLFLSLFAMMTLGSCSSFQTPISRGITQEPLTVPEFHVETQPIIPELKKPDLIAKTDLFDWPVNDARMTRGFLPQKRRPHLGIDLAAKRGTPILAAQAGMIIYTGREFRGYGKMILIESGNGWATLYAHMDKILVQEGQRIAQGQLIGAMGRTGRATGVHLHFEIRKDKGPIDPLPLLPHGDNLAANANF